MNFVKFLRTPFLQKPPDDCFYGYERTETCEARETQEHEENELREHGAHKSTRVRGT